MTAEEIEQMCETVRRLFTDCYEVTMTVEQDKDSPNSTIGLTFSGARSAWVAHYREQR